MGRELVEELMKFEGTSKKVEMMSQRYVSADKVTLQFLEISGSQ